MTSNCSSPLIHAAIDTLNSAVDLDSGAMREMIFARPRCNEYLADHPTIQCSPRPSGGMQVGFMGVLNGILIDAAKALGFTPEVVAAQFRNDGTLEGFCAVEYIAENPDAEEIEDSPTLEQREDAASQGAEAVVDGNGNVTYKKFD